ncbi:MAG: ribbon-helix-helix protein, CopG family [Thaumarchaeota archaeon]|nr:ribbon-helix-helix protein, CopG family [Nitrososphaerota archaeon]
MSSQKEYTSIKVPVVLADKIKGLAEKQGYRSVSEFIMEATRKHLKDLS